MLLCAVGVVGVVGVGVAVGGGGVGVVDVVVTGRCGHGDRWRPFTSPCAVRGFAVSGRS